MNKTGKQSYMVVQMEVIVPIQRRVFTFYTTLYSSACVAVKIILAL